MNTGPEISGVTPSISTLTSRSLILKDARSVASVSRTDWSKHASAMNITRRSLYAKNPQLPFPRFSCQH